MEEIHRELQEIRGLIYLLERAPHEKKSHKSTEIIARIRKLLDALEKQRKRNFHRVNRALSVLVRLLETGHVSIETVEDRTAFQWALSEVHWFLDNQEDL